MVDMNFLSSDPASLDTLGLHGRRPRLGADFQAIRNAVRTTPRSIHSHVLNEPLPERIAELLSQLDQQLRQLDEPKDAGDVAH
jgi:Anti-sigma factor NepR